MQTLVTLLDTTTPTPSQVFHRLSTKATPLQESTPSTRTYKFDEVIELPKYDL